MRFFSELKRRNVIRMAALYAVGSWLILQVAEVLAEALDVPDWTLRFILMVLLLGFPLALIFSWVYEITPEGLKKEVDVAPDASVTTQTAKKLDLAVIGLLVAVLAVVALDRLLPESASVAETAPEVPAQILEENEPASVPPADPRSVAVLPFQGFGSNSGDDYFSDGLTETLQHMLAQVPELRVAARTSSFAFRDKTTDIREIAEKLNVANILEGSVQRAGDRVRIRATLSRAADNSVIWSEQFDKTVNDVFAI
ncbi:MAG: adenylyl cyclase, partial [Pseudomonadota bacterium]